MFDRPSHQVDTLRSLVHSMADAFAQRFHREYFGYTAAPDAPVSEELVEGLTDDFDQFARRRGGLSQPEPEHSDAFYRAMATAVGVEPIPAAIEDELGVDLYQHLISRFYSAYQETSRAVWSSPAARRSRWLEQLAENPEAALRCLQDDPSLRDCLLLDDVLALLEQVGEEGTDTALLVLEEQDVSDSTRVALVERTLWALELRSSLREAIQTISRLLESMDSEDSPLSSQPLSNDG